MPFLKSLLSKLGVDCPDPTPTPPPGESRPGIEFCYFGLQDGDAAQIHDHVTMAHVGSWGDWSSTAFMHQMFLDFMQECVNSGIERIMVTLDWCLFTNTEPKQPLSNDECVARLIGFFDFLRNNDMLKYVAAYYVIDEPDIPQNNISDTQMLNAIARIRDVLNAYQPSPVKGPLCVIYGPNNHYPGISGLDWAGFDNYGAPIFSNGQYAGLVSRLSPAQKTIIVPGGSNPWREDPKPFYDHAQGDPRVAMIMPFTWFSSPPGTTDGIGLNGMAPQYRAVGTLIKDAQP